MRKMAGQQLCRRRFSPSPPPPPAGGGGDDEIFACPKLPSQTTRILHLSASSLPLPLVSKMSFVSGCETPAISPAPAAAAPASSSAPPLPALAASLSALSSLRAQQLDVLARHLALQAPAGGSSSAASAAFFAAGEAAPPGTAAAADLAGLHSAIGALATAMRAATAAAAGGSAAAGDAAAGDAAAAQPPAAPWLVFAPPGAAP
jgi:hypothetical protein